MARTRASVGIKITGGKNSKKAVRPTQAPVAKGRLPSTSKSRSGGNPYCRRSTPKWQRPITNFFKNGAKASDDSGGTSCDTDDEKENTKQNKQKPEDIEEEEISLKNKGIGKKSKSKPVNEISEEESNIIDIDSSNTVIE